MRCFFDLLIIPLSYNFGGCFKITYPSTSLEYWPLDVVKPSFLASKPSSTYTLIASWCKSTLKIILIIFFKLIFLKSYGIRRDLWWALCPLLAWFMVLIIFFTTSMGNMKMTSPLLSHFQAWGRVTPFRTSLFALTHYQTFLETIAQAPNYVFPSLMNDTHIMGLMNEIILSLNYFTT